MIRRALALSGVMMVMCAGCAHDARVSRVEACGAVVVHGPGVAAFPTEAPPPFDSPESYRRYQADSGQVVNDQNETKVRSVRETH